MSDAKKPSSPDATQRLGPLRDPAPPAQPSAPAPPARPRRPTFGFDEPTPPPASPKPSNDVDRLARRIAELLEKNSRAIPFIRLQDAELAKALEELADAVQK
jgi:pyruvate/2-oxoglutarate dehydrogenase complex dihydrolipoamide acyltransferase (E2) component